MKNITLELNGRAVSAVVAYAQGTVWVHMEGETFAYEVPKRENRRGRKSGQGGVHPGEIAAPMPGKIIKTLVEPGDQVVAHQVVVVMEAMKMEYTLKASEAGKVASVDCAAGDQVSLGQILVRIEC